jgi:hypothetical protein
VGNEQDGKLVVFVGLGQGVGLGEVSLIVNEMSGRLCMRSLTWFCRVGPFEEDFVRLFSCEDGQGFTRTENVRGIMMIGLLSSGEPRGVWGDFRLKEVEGGQGWSRIEAELQRAIW